MKKLKTFEEYMEDATFSSDPTKAINLMFSDLKEAMDELQNFASYYDVHQVLRKKDW